MDVIYPKNTPKIVKSGEAQFVNKELLIKLINENGMNATYVSKHVFFDRGKRHAPNKIGDWLKYRYPAKIEDLKAVWQYLDLIHKYDWKDLCFTDYQSPECGNNFAANDLDYWINSGLFCPVCKADSKSIDLLDKATENG